MKWNRGSMNWRTALLATAIITAAAWPAQAEELLRNGDFSNGLDSWHNNGQIAYLDANGDPVDKDAGGTPVLELKLTKNRFTVASQTFRSHDKLNSITVEVVLRASADFARNDRSSDYSNVEFKPGGWWCWSAIVYPKADFFVRVADDFHFYSLTDVKAGEDWKKLQVHFGKINPNVKERIIFLNGAPGDGSLYIKSVSVTTP